MWFFCVRWHYHRVLKLFLNFIWLFLNFNCNKPLQSVNCIVARNRRNVQHQNQYTQGAHHGILAN
jgi:hypothetical protein